LVAERAMSRKLSTPISRRMPASGMPKLATVAAMITSDARGTPATPLLVMSRVKSIRICCPSGMSMP
jgi:hypothetical protein